jgi:predicted dehydrogenase
MTPARSASDRRTFLKATTTTSATFLLGSAATASAAPVRAQSEKADRKVKVAVIGCGSVSTKYFPHLKGCPYVDLVAACDIKPERARRAAEQHGIPRHFSHMEQLLAGSEFEMLVNLTDMQEHEHLNREAIDAGKHVWSEKPIANSYEAGQELLDRAVEKRLILRGAPTPVASPQFAFMNQALREGKLGKVSAAHAAYGHLGPDWAAFFYEEGGGSLPDLAVYNLTTLTGLLGPAKSVMAMLNIVTPRRNLHGDITIRVTEEDNAHVLLEHAGGALSHIQSGFNYFDPHGHEGTGQTRPTITLTGTGGAMGLIGYDWAPQGVELATSADPILRPHCTDPQGYVWQNGASLMAQSLATGERLPFTAEHALHVVEIITAARESSLSGQRMKLQSTFEWPIQV